MTPAQARAYWRKRDREKLAYERKYIRAFKRALRKQINPILAYIDTAPDPAKVVDQVELLIDDKPIQDTFTALHREVGLNFLMQSARNLKASHGQITTKDEVDDFIQLWELVVAQYIKDDALEDLRTILATSKDDALRIIRDIVGQGIDEGLGIPEMRRMMNKEIPKAWRTRYFRAEVIARTEVGAAAEFGSFKGAESTGLPFDKMWITRVDGRERDSHRAISGQVVKMHERFGNGLKYPNEKGAPAEEVIQCRCSAGYIRPQ